MGIEPMYGALQTPAPRRVMPAQRHEVGVETAVEGWSEARAKVVRRSMVASDGPQWGRISALTR